MKIVACELLSTVFSNDGETANVAKRITYDNGSSKFILHIFDLVTITNWMKLYGTDNVTEVIEFILYEPYLGENMPSEMAKEDALTTVRYNVQKTKDRLKPKELGQLELIPITVDQHMMSAGISNEFIEALKDDPIGIIVDNYNKTQPVSAFDQYTTNVRRKDGFHSS